MTHRSYSHRNNERLEFLGDAILDFLIAERLYQKFPSAKEGQLSRLRAQLVKRETLAALARDIELGDFLVLGSGEMKSGGSRRDSILADVFEAVIGAMYLDCGLQVVSDRINEWYSDRLAALSLDDTQKDPKTRLQEYLQGKGLELPEYVVAEIGGKAHDRTFYIECKVALLAAPTLGKGSSRRFAEQEAAAEALKRLGIPE